MSKEEITKILYENSSDDSECLRIKFENINKVIDLLFDLSKEDKKRIAELESTIKSYGDIANRYSHSVERIADLESQLLIANKKVELNYNNAKHLEFQLKAADSDYGNRIKELESILKCEQLGNEGGLESYNELESKYNELSKVADEMVIELEYLSEFNSVLTKYKELISK